MELTPAKEKLLIENLLSSADTFALCTSIVHPEYFTPHFSNSVKFIQDYYDEFNSLPSPEIVEAETGELYQTRTITKDQIEYTTKEIEKFCQYNALKTAIFQAPALMEKGDYSSVQEIIKEAILVSLNKDLGIDYFQTVEERLERMSKEEGRLSTGWRDVDEVLFGGPARGELIVWSANSGVGKSVILANYGLNQTRLGRKVLYISLELSEDLIAQRYDTMISGVPTATWKYQKEKIVQSVEKEALNNELLTIKRMASGAKPKDIRAYLKEYELKKGATPDIIIIDYMDLMEPNSRISAENVFAKDKAIAEGIREIGHDYQCVIASASQQNRGAVDEVKIKQSHVAGGMSKINTSDVWISIVATDQMKQQGECRFLFVKTRSSDGVGKQVTLNWGKNIRITDCETSTIQSVHVDELTPQPGKQIGPTIEEAAVIGDTLHEDLLGAFEIDDD